MVGGIGFTTLTIIVKSIHIPTWWLNPTTSRDFLFMISSRHCYRLLPQGQTFAKGFLRNVWWWWVDQTGGCGYYTKADHSWMIIYSWLVVWNMFFPYIGKNNPNWRTPSFFRGVETTNQIVWNPIINHLSVVQFCELGDVRNHIKIIQHQWFIIGFVTFRSDVRAWNTYKRPPMIYIIIYILLYCYIFPFQDDKTMLNPYVQHWPGWRDSSHLIPTWKTHHHRTCIHIRAEAGVWWTLKLFDVFSLARLPS